MKYNVTVSVFGPSVSVQNPSLMSYVFSLLLHIPIQQNSVLSDHLKKTRYKFMQWHFPVFKVLSLFCTYFYTLSLFVPLFHLFPFRYFIFLTVIPSIIFSFIFSVPFHCVTFRVLCNLIQVGCSNLFYKIAVISGMFQFGFYFLILMKFN
jgi:hypothetical protein